MPVSEKEEKMKNQLRMVVLIPKGASGSKPSAWLSVQTKTTSKMGPDKTDIDYKEQQQSLLCRRVLIITAAACMLKNINVKRSESLLGFKNLRDFVTLDKLHYILGRDHGCTTINGGIDVWVEWFMKQG